MPKVKYSASKPNGNDSGLNFKAQLWAAAEQAVPAPYYGITEYNRARPEGLCLGVILLKYNSDPKSEWFGQPIETDTKRLCNSDSGSARIDCHK